MPGRSVTLTDFNDIAAVIVFSRTEGGQYDVVPVEIDDAVPVPRRTIAFGLRAMADQYEAQADTAGDL